MLSGCWMGYGKEGVSSRTGGVASGELITVGGDEA